MAVQGRTAPLSLLTLLLILMLAAPLPASLQDAGPFAPAEVHITENVVATDVEPLGANVSTLAGGTNLFSNNLIRGSGMEPGVARYLVRVERAGPGWIEWDESLGGVAMWDQNRTGFGDGATVRFYRLVDAEGQPLAYAGDGERDLGDVTGAARGVFLTETTVPTGGWIAEGTGGQTNRVYVEDTATAFAYGDYAIITVTRLSLTEDDVHPRLLEWFNPNPNYLSPWDGNGSAQLVPHTGDLPPDFTEPGQSALQLTAGEGGAWFGQYLFHAYDEGEGQFYSQLEPGAAYRAEVWLRQEGLADGQVRFLVGGAYAGTVEVAPWQVTETWQRFTVDFTGPPYPAPGSWHGALGLEVGSAGTLWVDNFVVYRNDAEHDFRPFTPNRLALDALLDSLPATGPKPAIRFYAITYHSHASMAHLLSNYDAGTIDFIYNLQPGSAATIPHILAWALATGDSAAERVVPYITLSEEHSAIEWMQLAEYLGVPYDPQVDTPEAKPWAYLRYQQRGTGTPWTDEFREIVLEFGNETWHNGAFGGWDGFGRPNWVFFGGREYGLFAHHFFVEGLTAQPWWDAYNLGDKITLALNAGYSAEPDAYGELAVQQVPELAVYLGHANYVGPTWETGAEAYPVFDDFGLQETLVSGYLIMHPLITQVAETRAQLMGAGLANYRPIAYEGGPSGYAIPGTVDDAQVQVAELYGKSLAMAVNALDTFLFSSLNGYGHQAFNAFIGGEYWSSHTMPGMGGFRPHASWLALTLRNRYARGTEMLATRFESVPTYTRDGATIPLIAAYTLRDETSLSVFVLSRKLDGGAFGDGTTPVTLYLPLTGCSAVTRYALTAPDGTPADPRANNIDADRIVINAVPVDPAVCADGTLTIGPETGGIEGGLPPGTVYLYVFER